MADPFVAEIRIFPYTFVPKGWAWCQGQLMSVTQNTALFSLLGTYFGGDGQSTFALPDLQGRVAVHPGQGPGLSPYQLGEMAGSETVTLLQSELPSHTHQVRGSNVAGNRTRPAGNSLARASAGSAYIPPSGNTNTQHAFETLPPAGGGLPHNNLMPYLTLHYAICILGVYPAFE